MTAAGGTPWITVLQFIITALRAVTNNASIQGLLRSSRTLPTFVFCR